jgi:hypothetical protein
MMVARHGIPASGLRDKTATNWHRADKKSGRSSARSSSDHGNGDDGGRGRCWL